MRLLLGDLLEMLIKVTPNLYLRVTLLPLVPAYYRAKNRPTFPHHTRMAPPAARLSYHLGSPQISAGL